MGDAAIRVEGLGKQYRIGELVQYKTLRDSVREMAGAPFRLAGSLMKGNTGGSRGRNKNNMFWALKDLSFEVKKGEAVGVIGSNGSGKSTLLKILSRITEPTEGFADIHGRVGSLLEVGTGFHRELTGRENIYLNGAILGMKKREIDLRFDEIVAFSEIERFLDTPVKHYSTGMYVRLGFAVAAHMEPEILLVDEVLAVGDASFQKKCLGKMAEVAGQGRTVLFVSHNMGAVVSLCSKGILLQRGSIGVMGTTRDAVAGYRKQMAQATEFEESPMESVAYILGGAIQGSHHLHYGDTLQVELRVYSHQALQTAVYWRIRDAMGMPVATGLPQYQLGEFQHLGKGNNTIRLAIGPLPLFKGEYSLSFDLNHGGVRYLQRLEDRLSFDILECSPNGVEGGYLRSDWGSGSVVIPFEIQVETE